MVDAKPAWTHRRNHRCDRREEGWRVRLPLQRCQGFVESVLIIDVQCSRTEGWRPPQCPHLIGLTFGDYATQLCPTGGWPGAAWIGDPLPLPKWWLLLAIERVRLRAVPFEPLIGEE